jgi:hypothetical protein
MPDNISAGKQLLKESEKSNGFYGRGGRGDGDFCI